jgi:hypothetical protein
MLERLEPFLELKTDELKWLRRSRVLEVDVDYSAFRMSSEK